MAKAPAIGINLGTTNSRVGVFQHGKFQIIANDRGNRTTPSYVAFTDNGNLIGDVAKDQSTRNSKNTIFNVNKLMGRRFDDSVVQADMKNWPFEVIDDKSVPKIRVKIDDETETFSPEEISSMMLGELKKTAEAHLGTSVKKAVIAVPAGFSDSQRQATKNAAKIAGLEVLQIINEPTAAALAYGLENKNPEERNVLIFDLGGGTFDVSILKIKNGFFKVLSTDGDTHLGGDDFDHRMVIYATDKFKLEHNIDLTEDKNVLRRFKIACEEAKRTLSSFTKATIAVDPINDDIDFYVSITRDRFEEMNAELFQNTIKLVERVMRDAKMDKDQIHDIVLVGGSTSIPKVQKLLQDYFNGRTLKKFINLDILDEAVAYGAAVQAAVLNGDKSKEINNLLISDVTSISIGIGAKPTNEMIEKAVFIPRNSSIPAKTTKSFIVTNDYQTNAKIFTYEGEFIENKYNELLGEFDLLDIPSAPRGEVKIDITFSIDVDGILDISADETFKGKKNPIVISCQRNRLSENEIESMIQKAENNVVKAKEKKVNAKNLLKSYCIEMKNNIKNEKLKNINIDKSDEDLILEICDETICWLGSGDTAPIEEYKRKQSTLKSVFDTILELAEEPDKKKEKYHIILGIRLGASIIEIEEAYEKAVLHFHPVDEYKGPKLLAKWMLANISKARNFLVGSDGAESDDKA